jgi:hypothetical protein
MKLQNHFCSCAVGAALTFAVATPVVAADLFFSGLRVYLAAGSTAAADPGVLVVLGAGLIGLRVFIGKRSKRREKEL